MESRVSPCDRCQKQDKANCVGCLAWREWYCYRQSMINAYAMQIESMVNAYTAQLEKNKRYWIYGYPDHKMKADAYAESRVFPCENCSVPDNSDCVGCDRWREWYCYRQSLINAYAEKLSKYWVYDIPIHPITKEETYADIQTNQQRQDCNHADQST